MQKLKFKNLLKKTEIKNKVYVIFDKKIPIYVGMARAQSVQARMLNHALNYFVRSPFSKISELMFRSKSSCFDWPIGICDIQQVQMIIGQKPCCLKCAERGLYLFYRKIKGYRLPGNVRLPYGCEKSRRR